MEVVLTGCVRRRREALSQRRIDVIEIARLTLFARRTARARRREARGARRFMAMPFSATWRASPSNFALSAQLTASLRSERVAALPSVELGAKEGVGLML
jgi:hypothetical protein